jgi:hypothetical protein
MYAYSSAQESKWSMNLYYSVEEHLNIISNIKLLIKVPLLCPQVCNIAADNRKTGTGTYLLITSY